MKRILSIIIALSFILMSVPVTFAQETEKSTFTFSKTLSKHVAFSWSNGSKIESLADLGTATSKWFRAYHDDSKITIPRESALLAFTVADTSSLTDDDKVYLNLKVDGFGATLDNAMYGGKIKVIYSIAGYPVNTAIDKSLYALSENTITEDATDFKIDVTSIVKTALSNTTPVQGTRTFQLLVEVDPAGTPLNDAGTRFYNTKEFKSLGGYMMYEAAVPSMTVEEITPELSDIKIDGVSLKDFEASETEYTYDVAYSYQGLPQITAITKYPESTAVVLGPSQIPGNAVITVTTPSGKTKTYTIDIGRAEVSPELTDIKIDGVSVEGFESSYGEYTHILAHNYNKTPEISVVKKDPDASAAIEIPSQIPGYVIINVTTPDSKTKTYKVYLKRREVLTELSDIKIDGESIEGFNSSKTEYTYYIADNYQGLPIIVPEKADNIADVVVIMPDLIPGTCYIEVSNYTGKLTRYVLKLRYESSKTNPTTITTLPKVTYTGAVGTVIDAVPANATVNATLDLRELRDEDNITFVTALYNDGFMIDKVSSKKQGNETSLTNTLNVTLSDVSKAQIKSFILNDYKNGNSIINCATLTSTNNNLKALSFNNSIIAGFNKSILNYKFKVPASVLNYPELLFKTEDSGVKTEITYPAKLSGTVNVKTTANNGDSKTYSVEFEREDAKVTNVTMDYESFDPNSNLKIYENIQNPIYSGANEVISEITNPILLHTGRTYLVKNMEDKFLGGTFISLPMDGLIPTTNTKMAEYLDKTGFITFDINRSATVYIAWNDVSMPAWASAEGFTEVSNATGNITATSDTATMQMNKIYKKYYEVSEWSETPVTVSLGAINQHKYWWIIVVFDD